MAHLGKMISLKSGDGAAINYYHVAAQGPRKGGLVCVMEIFGVTDHIKDVCDAWARDGLEVISPALYDRQEKNFLASYSPEDIQKKAAQLFHNGCHEYNSAISAGDLIPECQYTLIFRELFFPTQKQIHQTYARTIMVFRPKYLAPDTNFLCSSRQRRTPRQVHLIFQPQRYQASRAIILHRSWL